jgi:hypothetical protein
VGDLGAGFRAQDDSSSEFRFDLENESFAFDNRDLE